MNRGEKGMLELTFNLMKEYRDMYPDDADTMTRAWMVSKRNRLVNEFTYLLEEALESGRCVDWTVLFAAVSEPVLIYTGEAVKPVDQTATSP